VKSPHLALVGFAATSLLRRKARTLTLVVGLAASVALLASVFFVTGALRDEARRVRGAAPDLVVQKLVGGRPSVLDPSLAPTIARIPGVKQVVPRVWGYLFLASIQSNVAIVGSSSRGPLALSAGRDLQVGERGTCVLGKELADTLGLRLGDHLIFPLPGHRAADSVVVGLFSSDVSLYTSDVALVADEDARLILGVPRESAVDLAVELTNPDESQVAARKLGELFPGARVVEKRVLDRTLALVYGRRAGFVLGASLPALLALFVLAWDRAAGLAPSERREIAILKACGWSTSDVLRVKLYEAFVVAFAGGALGIVLAYLWSFPFGAPGLREVLSGWAVLYPRTHLVPSVDGAQVLSVLALVTAPFLALSVGPAWRAAGVDPLEALREG
jgi:ABC-type lipoprotein release transport system permease subunit